MATAPPAHMGFRAGSLSEAKPLVIDRPSVPRRDIHPSPDDILDGSGVTMSHGGDDAEFDSREISAGPI